MIVIKVDCCGCPQTSMQFKRLDVLRRYAGERVKTHNTDYHGLACLCTTVYNTQAIAEGGEQMF